MFQIYNGRKAFWQWDSGQRLVVSDERCQQVHFQKENDEKALVCDVQEENGQRFAFVPDALLQSAQRLYAYALTEVDGGFRVLDYRFFDVYPRAKPEDYICTEQEHWTVEKAVADAMQSYVKQTDYASNKRAGLVRIYNSKGIQVNAGSGVLSTVMATEKNIREKTHGYSVITPQNLDYAVLQSIANNKKTMTGTEKKHACSWLGALMVQENADGSITVTLPSGKAKTVDLSKIEVFL